MSLSGTVTLRRGRYTLIIWPPVRFTFERGQDAIGRDDGWNWVGWAWTWSRPKRWTFPHDPTPDRPVIMQCVTCGPIDLRRMARRLAVRDDPPASGV